MTEKQEEEGAELPALSTPLTSKGMINNKFHDKKPNVSFYQVNAKRCQGDPNNSYDQQRSMICSNKKFAKGTLLKREAHSVHG